VACAHSNLSSCPETTEGHLEFVAGEQVRLGRAETFAVTVVSGGAEIARLEKALISAVQRRIPQWRYEADQTKADVTIEVSSVDCQLCVDCDIPEYRPRWLSAEVVIDHGLARARWSQAMWSRSTNGLVGELAEAMATFVKGKAA
jgi:hypothetical protein